MKYISFIFLMLLLCQSVYSQSKKEQIANLIYQKDSLGRVLEKERQLNTDQVKQLEAKISKVNSDMTLIKKELAESKKELLQSKKELAESKEELAGKEEEILGHQMAHVLRGDTIMYLREELHRIKAFIKLISFSQPVNSVYIIGKGIRVGNLLVAENDFLHPMSWYDAVEACAALGEGWRLPNKDELNLIYQNRDKIGGFFSSLEDFPDSYYWSSTETANYGAWCQSFYDGDRHSLGKFGDYDFYVRAVRSF